MNGRTKQKYEKEGRKEGMMMNGGKGFESRKEISKEVRQRLEEKKGWLDEQDEKEGSKDEWKKKKV